MPTRKGSIRLFQFRGITVYLHWLWFVVALYEIQQRAQDYSNYLWCALEVVSLFGIVLLHEFGHAFACRSVGGKAEQIFLWPLGGVAYVAPPPRPGPMLWSIAAGPLVNVVLLPVFLGVFFLGRSAGWAESLPDLYTYLQALCFIDIGLLVFNLMPVYPLDGGQILQSLLWFVLGRARSLMVASIIGLLGVAGLFVWAFASMDWWLGLIGFFVLMNCWAGLKRARALGRIAKMPRRPGYACPECKNPPILGAVWRCAKCGEAFDTFETHAQCPRCRTEFPVTACLDCGRAHPLNEWVVVPPLPTVTVAPPVIPTSDPER